MNLLDVRTDVIGDQIVSSWSTYASTTRKATPSISGLETGPDDTGDSCLMYPVRNRRRSARSHFFFRSTAPQTGPTKARSPCFQKILYSSSSATYHA